MDLTKKIELHFRHFPIEAGTESMKSSLKRETEYCALYAQNDVPAEIHNRTTDIMMDKFGIDSKFDRETNRYIRPFTVNSGTGLAGLPPIIPPNVGITASTLRGSGYKVGGMFFDMEIAEQVLGAFQELGYEIIKKHD